MAAKLDISALGQVVNQRRHAQDVSLVGLAEKFDCTEAELRGLEAGDEPFVGLALRAVKWLGASLDDFLIEDSGAPVVDPDARAESVAAFLRSDRDLKPESAEAIEAVLQAAYARFSAA